MNDVKRYVNTSGHSTKVACNFLAVVWSSRIWGKCRASAEPGGRLEEARGSRAPSGLILPGGDSPKAHAWSPPIRSPQPSPLGPASPPSAPAARGEPKAPRTSGREPLPHLGRSVPTHPVRACQRSPPPSRRSRRPGLAPPPHSPPRHCLHSPRESRVLLHRVGKENLGAGPGGTVLVPSGCERDRTGWWKREREEGTLTRDGVQARQREQPQQDQGHEASHRHRSSPGSEVRARSRARIYSPRPGRQSEPCPPGRHRSPSERGPGRLERGTSRFSVSFSGKSRDA